MGESKIAIKELHRNDKFFREELNESTHTKFLLNLLFVPASHNRTVAQLFDVKSKARKQKRE